MILDWMWLKEYFGEEVCTCDIGVKGKKMQLKCALIIAMENGWCVLMALCWCFLFYLENDKNIGIVIHISKII